MASNSSCLAESQRRDQPQPNDQQVYVTILEVNHLPLQKQLLLLKRKFYLTVTDGTTSTQTKATRSSDKKVITWRKKLGPFDPSRDITLSLHSQRKIGDDEPIGTLTMKPVGQTEASHPIVCDLDVPPNIILKVDVEGPIPAAVSAMDEAGDALLAMNVREEWKTTLERIQFVMQIVNTAAELSPYSKVACKALSSLLQLFSAQLERDRNVQALSEAMQDAFNMTEAEELLKAIKPNSNQALILKLMLRHITICSDVIQRYAKDQSFAKRLLKNITDGVSEEIKGLCDTLLQLKQNLVDNAVINTQIGVKLVQNTLEILSSKISDIDYDAKIDDLPYKSGWTLTSTKNGCIAGTRTAFLDYILEWIRNPSSKRMMVLFGQAGTGKSTIAYEIASLFCIEDHLCPYFSFTRADKSKREDHHLLTTLIRDLADRHDTFKSALGALIQNNTPLRKSDDLNRLFDNLLIPSLLNVGPSTAPELIVIDALDESSDPCNLAEFLAQSLNRLPENFRVLITSRPEHDVVLALVTGQEAAFATIQMNDPVLAANTEDDIRVYLQKHLSPSDFEQYGEALIKKSEGLFQWVVVATGYLKKPPPGFTRTTCILGILGQTSDDKEYARDLMAPLHTLYTTVLAGYFTTKTAKSLFRSVMSQFFSALEPISVDTLTRLRQYMPCIRDDEAVPAIVQYLGSLLTNTSSDKRAQPVVPLHISFRDFLVDLDHQHTFSIDLPTAHVELAHACIDIMLEKLEFNICKLESSYLRNSEVHDLQARIDKWIHPSLQYACRFWHHHVGQINVDDILLDKLAMFFMEKILNWLEVMSLINQIFRTRSALSSLIDYLQVDKNTVKTSQHKLNEIVDLVTDSFRFSGYFGHAIAASAPHIYISTLPFTPTSSHIFQTYSPAFPSTLSLQRGQLDYWPALDMTITFQTVLSSVAVSPDGQWIATGCDDSSVTLWNSTTRVREGKPLIGHINRVTSVAFSPDGQHIVSGSLDGTICVWNISKGEMRYKPLSWGKSVLSVAFSPDGEYIASGSSNGTVGVWKASSGNKVGTPLEGHSNSVKAVAFSPDGKYIVSGSSDETLLLWNLSTQTVEGQPFLGHTGHVNSVAFSQDGRHIVSGSDDNTIRLWDISTQTREGITFSGHTASVNSVSFSPDGKWIASGSDDTTVCIWNAATGVLNGSPMIGQPTSVISVAFFPDSRHLVSISYYDKLCVWNVPPPVMNSRVQVRNITAVAFLSDGHNIISGSADGTICLWNVATQRTEGAPLTGPRERISAVASSPDGKWIASGYTGGKIILWDTSTSVQHATLIAHSKSLRDIIAFSPDGGHILSGSSDGTISMWAVSLGTMVFNFDWDNGAIEYVAFSIDGQHILSVSSRATVCKWNISTRSLQKYSYPGETNSTDIFSATISRDGQQAAFGMADGTVHLMDVLAESVKSVISTGHTEWVSSVSFSPDGKMLASGSADGRVQLWDMSTGTMKELKVPARYTHNNTEHVCFSSDGNYLFSLAGAGRSSESRIRLWHVPGFTKISTSPIVGSLDMALTDESVIDGDGWICGSQGELLMWIPPIHRLSLHRPSNIFILGGHETRLDTSKFVHGSNWGKCRHK